MGIRKGCTTDELRAYLKDKMEGIAGTRDLERANKRTAMLQEWRYENED